jgi:type I restriction enzyme S subunit
MELMTEEKKGFKKTEVGLISEDWELKKVGEFLEFKNGLNKAKEFFGKGTPIINYMDTFRHPGLKKENIQGKVTLTKDEIRRFNVQKGDVFFTRTSETVQEIGVSAVLEEDIENGVFSGFILRGRPKNEDLSLKFKRYCFSSEIVRKQIVGSATYTTRALTNGRHLSKVLLPLPPTLAEQQAIATALSDVDELIRSLDGLIQKKEAIKKGTMQQLLTGRKRLPGFDGEWEVKALGEFAENISSGKSNTKTKVGKFPVYGSTGIIGWDTTYDYIGDRILVARVGANAGTVNQVNGKYNVSDNTLMITLKSNVNIDFIRYYLIHYDLGTLIFGSGQPLITGGQLKKLDIEIPNLDLQNKIVEILSDMDREIQVLRQKREKAGQIKQGMMQELLTGKTRLV